MISISSSEVSNIWAMDAQLKAVIPSAIGVSVGSFGTILYLPDEATTAQKNNAEAMLFYWDELTVNADKTTMNEGDADPVITVASGDAELGYVVLLDDELYASGDVVPVAGTATLNLVSPSAGAYEVFVYRKVDDFSSGQVTITVNEV